MVDPSDEEYKNTKINERKVRLFQLVDRTNHNTPADKTKRYIKIILIPALSKTKRGTALPKTQ